MVSTRLGHGMVTWKFFTRLFILYYNSNHRSIYRLESHGLRLTKVGSINITRSRTPGGSISQCLTVRNVKHLNSTKNFGVNSHLIIKTWDADTLIRERQKLQRYLLSLTFWHVLFTCEWHMIVKCYSHWLSHVLKNNFFYSSLNLISYCFFGISRSKFNELLIFWS